MTPYTIRVTKTQISNSELKDAPPFADVAGRIKDMIESAPVVIAHNVSFDKEILDLEFARAGMTVKWPRLICTIEQTMYLEGKRLSLTKLHTLLFGEGFPSAHRAKNDVMALLACCCELDRKGLL